MKINLKFAKRISLKLASGLPIPLILRLSDGQLTPKEIAELAEIISVMVMEEIADMNKKD